MSITTKPTILALAIPALGVFFSASAHAYDPDKCYYESRSGDNIECSHYRAEISNTRAFLETVVNRGKWTKNKLHPVIIDVRSTPEYKAGHPEHSYNVPYPYIYQACDNTGRHPDGACKKAASTTPQDPDDFVDYVESIIPNKDTPIYTMCRTGVRSVLAGNKLEAAGYTNVRNMWEGFVGVPLTAPFHVLVDDDNDPNTPEVEVIQQLQVDLNHDDAFTDEDKNGWRYHGGLPYDTRLLPPLIYKWASDTYYLP
jgi:rhodanese-related sulfurtransferase